METFFTIFVTFVLLYRARAEVELILTPEIVQPGITPFFTLRCNVIAAEGGNVASITLSRRTTRGRNIQTVPKELVAELRGLTPNLPIKAPGFEKVQIQGQISQFESELGSYLQVVWPQPGAEDFGLYTCETTIFQITGGLTLFAEVRVGTANPMTDYLLGVVHNLGDDIDTFNRTLQEIYTEIQDIKAAQKATPGTEEPETTTVGRPGGEIQTPTKTTPEDDIQQYETPTKEPFTQTTDLGRLTAAIERLEIQFERFNETLLRLDKLLTTLGQDAQDDVNETRTEQANVDVIRNYFIVGNSSYFLFQAAQNTDTSRAQAICESKRLYLAEINDQDEFLVISNELFPNVPDGELVLVGGQRASPNADWTYQRSQELVRFFVWGATEQAEAGYNECLALRKSPASLSFEPISCIGVQDSLFFLCEGD